MPGVSRNPIFNGRHISTAPLQKLLRSWLNSLKLIIFSCCSFQLKQYAIFFRKHLKKFSRIFFSTSAKNQETLHCMQPIISLPVASIKQNCKFKSFCYCQCSTLPATPKTINKFYLKLIIFFRALPLVVERSLPTAT